MLRYVKFCVYLNFESFVVAMGIYSDCLLKISSFFATIKLLPNFAVPKPLHAHRFCQERWQSGRLRRS